MQPENYSVESKMGPEKLLADSVVLTRLDKAVGWARKYSLFPYPFRDRLLRDGIYVSIDVALRYRPFRRAIAALQPETG